MLWTIGATFQSNSVFCSAALIVWLIIKTLQPLLILKGICLYDIANCFIYDKRKLYVRVNENVLLVDNKG
jgi:hypothetical protein